jgi:hypothetical protein
MGQLGLVVSSIAIRSKLMMGEKEVVVVLLRSGVGSIPGRKEA